MNMESQRLLYKERLHKQEQEPEGSCHHCWGLSPFGFPSRQIKFVFHQIFADEEVDHREDHRQDEARYEDSVEIHESIRAVL